MPRPALVKAFRSKGVVTDGLACHLRLETGSATAVSDVSGNGRHWTMGLSGSNLPPRVAQGLSFNQGPPGSILAGPLKFYRDVKAVTIVLKPGVKALAQAVLAPDGTNARCGLYPGTNQMTFNASPNSNQKGTTFLSGWNCLAWDFSNQKVRFSINGLPEIGYVQDVVTQYPTLPGDVKLYLGGLNPGNSDNFGGTAARVLLHVKPLSPKEHLQNAKALAAEVAPLGIAFGRFGSDLPANTPLMTWQGDSQWDGIGLSSASGNPSLTYQVQAALANNYLVHNLGLPGVAIQQVAPVSGQPNYGSVLADPLLAHSTASLKAYFCNAGTNDCANVANTPAAIFNWIKTNIIARKAAGYTAAAVCTILPRNDTGWNSTKEAIRTGVNALIMAEVPTHDSGLMYSGASWVDKVYDLGSEPALQTTTDTTVYNADQLHRTQAGYAIEAAGWMPVLAAFGFS